MRHFFFAIAIITLFNLQLIAQDSISVSDFRYPETKAIDLKANVTGGIHNQNYDEHSFYSIPSNPEYMSLSEDHNRSLNFYSTFLYFHSMEDIDNSFSFTGNYTPDWYDAYSESRSPLLNNSRELHADGQMLGSLAGWQYARYFAYSDFHLLGKSRLSYELHRSHYSIVDNLNSSTNTTSSSTDYIVDVSTYWGIGYGRVREGSFVIEAMRIIDKLKDDGIITDPLTHNQWLSLIDRVAHRREYTTNFERYSKYLARDILEELESSGVISKEKMTFYSAIKMTEVFSRPLQARFFGWRVYYILGPKNHEDSHDNEASYSYPELILPRSSSSHSFAKEFSLIHTIGGEWGYPLSLYTHLYSNASIELPTKDAGTRLNLYGNVSISYELGEKVSLVGLYSYSDEKTPSVQSFNPDNFDRTITHQLRGDIIIYLEDLINLTASMDYRTEHTNTYVAPGTSTLMLRNQNRSGLVVQFGVLFNII